VCDEGARKFDELSHDTLPLFFSRSDSRTLLVLGAGRALHQEAARGEEKLRIVDWLVRSWTRRSATTGRLDAGEASIRFMDRVEVRVIRSHRPARSLIVQAQNPVHSAAEGSWPWKPALTVFFSQAAERLGCRHVFRILHVRGSAVRVAEVSRTLQVEPIVDRAVPSGSPPCTGRRIAEFE